MESFFDKFISGCHILHYHNVLDAFGHLSFRHPSRPEIFIMSRNMAPGSVTSLDDLVEYYVENAEPVNSNAPRGFMERYIHSEIYKRYAKVNSVVHSHSDATVPYTISAVPLQACYHMAGFLGQGAPVWDIARCYGPADIKDMLIRNVTLGKNFSKSFTVATGSGESTTGNLDMESFPTHRVALMRGHGFTAVAESIEQCVMTAVYTQKNATIQTIAMTTHMAAPGEVGTRSIGFLSSEEASAATETSLGAVQRPWNLWCKEVNAWNLYVNNARNK